ncbi:hypothetical protein DMENIID0001_003970 [Sergentomyia squamirostris]
MMRRMYWFMGRKSKLSLANKLLLYKTVITPVWTYGIQLWGSAAASTVDILERFQNRMLRTIVDAPWYVTNRLIRKDLNVKSVKDMVLERCKTYKVRLDGHPNPSIASDILVPKIQRRLRRCWPSDLYDDERGGGDILTNFYRPKIIFICLF